MRRPGGGALQAALLRSDSFARLMRAARMLLAFCNSARRVALRPRPARFMKYVSMRNPDAGPFGETFLEASLRAIVAALLVNNPDGGCVESVFTLDTHLLTARFGTSLLCKSQ